jgi:3-oxoadipate enol-lactonase
MLDGVLQHRQAATRSRARWDLTDVGSESGPTFVLLHSLGLDRGVWGRVASRICAQARVVVPDLPGHGADAATAPLRSIVEAADQVIELLDVLNIESALICGISMGGAIAQEVALRHPQRVAGLGLLATMPKGVPAFLDRAAAAEAGGMDAVVEPTLQRWFTADDVARRTKEVRYAEHCVRTLPVSAWTAAWRKLATHDTVDRLPSITCPTVCIAGDLDPSTPTTLVRSIADRIPNATFHTIPGAPHLLTLTHPNDVSAHLRQLLMPVAA